ncbi:unnamed protein product [Vitrella brassicaformis CCMP3155]|uniref:Uncharacterized protein n=2 Tax=Vitrella brassicaformis TaxID=1169539 RepID=A0A0G4EAV1_VITBC|nr:unnamed protein product [Vitrella brassicaformis CCMP3155]|eukprot:CEL92578.1 unnamed protein product [Vitrella brassicaformis CCMP3155]
MAGFEQAEKRLTNAWHSMNTEALLSELRRAQALISTHCDDELQSLLKASKLAKTIGAVHRTATSSQVQTLAGQILNFIRQQCPESREWLMTTASKSQSGLLTELFATTGSSSTAAAAAAAANQGNASTSAAAADS